MGRYTLLVAVALTAACGPSQPALVCPTKQEGDKGFDEKKTYDTYEVEGATFGEFHKNMEKRAPFARRVDGKMPAAQADSKFCHSFSYLQEDAGCAVTGLTLVHVARITLPAWKKPANASAEDLAAYEKTLAILRTHEEVHFAISAAAARISFAELEQVKSAPTCGELESRITAKSQSIFDQLQAHQKDYDAATEHGMKQGDIDPTHIPAKWRTYAPTKVP